ncbi:MAG: DUF2975 domain-containing protein [Ilumatobacter sp.]|uniref:DUF2975 domain-containing protein n=1 Tax=Ilumatobacter sp. TaxID=1967498 RepID=UPI003C721A9F
MSSLLTKGSSASLGRTIEIFASIVMAFAVLGIVAPLIGGNGLRITDRPDGDDAMIEVVGSPSSAFDIDLGDPLPTTVDDDGNVSIRGQAVVEVGDPVTVAASMLDPTAAQRVVWLLWQISEPLLVLLIAWPIRQMARSTNTGDPFTTENVRRLWRISVLVMAGGVAVEAIANVAKMIIVQRSAAADLFAIEASLDLSPIFIGLVIAALASIWQQGVAMREELDATI